jgi:ATP-dependent Clp protease ATP-binding subunit ClpA
MWFFKLYSIVSFKQLIALDRGALIVGAKYRGEFEDRPKVVLQEVTDSDGQTILFIDEIHKVVGAGNYEGCSFLNFYSAYKRWAPRGTIRPSLIAGTTLALFKLSMHLFTVLLGYVPISRGL